MRTSRFTEEQIIGVLREVDAGAKIRDVIRRHGISEQTYHRWKGKYGGMDVSEARRLKALEDENRRLKHLVADLTLDNQALKALNGKNVWSAPAEQARSADARYRLHKCIRPRVGAEKAPGHDGNPRAPVLKNGRLREPHFWSGSPARRLCGSFISLITSRKRRRGAFGLRSWSLAPADTPRHERGQPR